MGAVTAQQIRLVLIAGWLLIPISVVLLWVPHPAWLGNAVVVAMAATGILIVQQFYQSDRAKDRLIDALERELAAEREKRPPEPHAVTWPDAFAYVGGVFGFAATAWVIMRR